MSNTLDIPDHGADGEADKKKSVPSDSLLVAAKKTLISQNLCSPNRREAGLGFSEQHADLVDSYLQARLAELMADIDDVLAECEGFALVAVGGYGRRELSPHSDIDLLIVCSSGIPTMALDIAQPLFLPLWDQGYDLGHGFRSIKDCTTLALENYQVFASLLDARYIAGSKEVFDALVNRIQQKLVKPKGASFVAWLAEQRQKRLARHGDASMLLEPQLKEGIGALRDWHSMLWAAKALGLCPLQSSTLEELPEDLFLERDKEILRESTGLLLQARNQLHKWSKRKNDLLHQELQPKVAADMGYTDRKHVLGVELFLSALHRGMNELKLVAEAFWSTRIARALPHCDLAPADVLDFDVESLAFLHGEQLAWSVFELFERSAVQGKSLSWQAMRTVADCRDELRMLASSPQSFTIFKRILLSGNASAVLGQMLDSGFLGALVPEFGEVSDHVQFDSYHTYPVGRHSLMTVASLEYLGNEDADHSPFAAGLWKNLSDKSVLLLAALFHDIGKPNPEHERLGAEIAATILKRWEVASSVIDDVAFLIEEHLLLPLTALRKDIGNETIVLECARQINGEERLEMLYLLSLTDAKATGPKAWSDWNRRLLAELYDKIRSMLHRGYLLDKNAAARIMENRDKVRALAGKSDLPGDFVEACLEVMPPGYTERTPAEDIVAHMALVRQLQKNIVEQKKRVAASRAEKGVVVLAAQPEQQGGVWRMTVVARKHFGLFATIAGVVSLHDLNIFSADAFTWSDQTAIILLQVSAPKDLEYVDEFWGRVRSSLKYALTGKLSVDYRLSQKRASFLSGGGVEENATPQVAVDNESSDFHSIIEVLTPDSIGLLYEIAHCLNSLELDIHMAKIATHGDQAADYFHVRDIYGEKVLDESHILEIRRALTHRLTETVVPKS